MYEKSGSRTSRGGAFGTAAAFVAGLSIAAAVIVAARPELSGMVFSTVAVDVTTLAQLVLATGFIIGVTLVTWLLTKIVL